MGLGYFCLNSDGGGGFENICPVIKTMCNNIQRRNKKKILKERNLQFQTETRNENETVKNVQIKVNCMTESG